MVKQIILPLLGVMAFIVLVGIFLQKSSKINTVGPKGTPIPSKIVSVNGREVKVEVAKTEDERKVGLSGRTSLDENSGMLFVFDPQNVKPVFWMKDTLIALDIIWINDGKVVKLDVNVQPPKAGTSDAALIKYTPSEPVDYVLEVPANYTVVHSIMVGNPVDVSRI